MIVGDAFLVFEGKLPEYLEISRQAEGNGSTQSDDIIPITGTKTVKYLQENLVGTAGSSGNS